MSLTTRFTQEYGLRTPIAQAGMAFVGSTPELAIAVCRAGGLGSLGVGLMPAPVLTDAVKAIVAGTAGAFNVNFITVFTDQSHIDAVCSAGVPVASFHWGHPSRAWIDQLHSAGTRVFEQVGSVDDARRAVDDGIDVVVAQGLEAGGHNFATLPTFALVPLVVDAAAPALVLASGGIADGRGLAAAISLGAQGVSMGTRFVASEECWSPRAYKERVVASGAADTVYASDLYHVNWPDAPHRVLRNRLVREWEDAGKPAPGRKPGEGTTIGVSRRADGSTIEVMRYTAAMPTGAFEGDLELAGLFAGESAELVHDIKPAGDIVREIARDADRILAERVAV